MKPLIDYTKGWEGITNPENYITKIQGMMSYFPMCCSAGVLKNVTAASCTESSHKHLLNKTTTIPNHTLPSNKQITDAKSIWELIRMVSSNINFLFPREVGHWYCLSLILKKTATGKDDSGDTAYGNYKCSQVTMFDRLLEDKDPKKGFRFQYNQIFSVDHFQEWLAAQEHRYGEFYLSPAVQGAHGARVRGGVLTPNLDALQAFEDEHLPIVRDHMLETIKFLSTIIAEPTSKDKIARSW